MTDRAYSGADSADPARSGADVCERAYSDADLTQAREWLDTPVGSDVAKHVARLIASVRAEGRRAGLESLRKALRSELDERVNPGDWLDGWNAAIGRAIAIVLDALEDNPETFEQTAERIAEKRKPVLDRLAGFDDGRRAGLEEALGRIHDMRMARGRDLDRAQSESRKQYIGDTMVGLQDAELAIRALIDQPADAGEVQP